MSTDRMIVAGVMSGTSADGIDVALVRIGDRHDSSQALASATGIRGRERPRHTYKLLGHAAYPYPRRVRAAVLAAMNARDASVADLSRLNFLLGELYADAVLAAQRRFRVQADLVGCHGQTLYHQGDPAMFLGRKRRRDLADGRSRHHRCPRRRARSLGFPSCRCGRGRQRRAAGSLPRLPALSRSQGRPHRAEHRRHCQSHRDPGGREGQSGSGLRHRPGKHGHRRGDGSPVPPAV